MAICKACGKNIKNGRIYCDTYCMQRYRLSNDGSNKCLIGKLCRSGAKELAVQMIKKALQDKDFRWIYSSRSDLYFALADLSKEQVLEGYDDDLKPFYANATRRGAKSKAIEPPPQFEGMTLKQIADMHNIHPRTLSDRIRRGISWEEALAPPM